MTLLFDSEVFSVSEMRNKAFRQKITQDAIKNMYVENGLDPDDYPFDMYDFQDDAGLVGAINKGTGGVLGNMAWDNAALRTGDGWYVPPQIPGAHGFGMVNDGGTSGYVGSVVSHNGNYVDGKQSFSLSFVFKADNDGEGGAGVLISKDGAYRVRFSAANTIIFEVWDGAAWRGSTTGANVTYDYWRVLHCVYDGTQAAANRIKMYLDAIDVTVAGASIPATLQDAGNVLYILDNAGNSAAGDGNLGLLAICPGLSMLQAQVQSLVELRGLFQPTVANQPTIITPGHFGAPEYDFDGAADPNSDHFRTYQSIPLKTSTGSVILWLSPDDFVLNNTPMGLCEPVAANYDEMILNIRGGVAGDPLELFGAINAALEFQIRWPLSLVNPNVNMVGFDSDGTTIRLNYNGNEHTPILNANNIGQWFASFPDANIFSLGARIRNTLVTPYNGKGTKMLIYDRSLTTLEYQQIYSRGFGPNGPRWYPQR